MKRLLLTTAVALVITEGCQTPKADHGTRADSAGSAAPGAASARDGSVDLPARRLLARGDTFDLRVSTGIALGSPEAMAKPCQQRPSVSEFLYILDTMDYAVSRVEYDCDKESIRTVGFQSTYRLAGDTVQFYEGDGNETFLGSRAVVTRDSLVTIGAAQSRSRYVRRMNAGAGSH